MREGLERSRWARPSLWTLVVVASILVLGLVLVGLATAAPAPAPLASAPVATGSPTR